MTRMPHSAWSTRPVRYVGLIDPVIRLNAHRFIFKIRTGSTGEPKGVMLSHKAQMIQARISRASTLTLYPKNAPPAVSPTNRTYRPHQQAQEKVELGQYDAATVYLSLAPLFHVAGLNSSIAVTLAGGTHVFLQAPGGPRGALSCTDCGVGWWWVAWHAILKQTQNHPIHRQHTQGSAPRPSRWRPRRPTASTPSSSSPRCSRPCSTRATQTQQPAVGRQRRCGRRCASCWSGDSRSRSRCGGGMCVHVCTGLGSLGFGSFSQ